MTNDPPPALRELRCPRCSGRGAYVGATVCSSCDVPLASVVVDDHQGSPAPMFVYRPWVTVVLAIVAVAFPFAPIPFLDNLPGIALKLAVSGSIMKIIRDYRESMTS